MAWKIFFYLFGLSCKPLDYAKGIRGNLLALWSLTINALLLAIVVTIVVLENIYPITGNDHFLRHFLMQYSGITAIVNLISVQLNSGFECEFWKQHDRNGPKLRKYKPSRSFKFKMFFELLNLALLFFVTASVLVAFGFNAALDTRRYFPCYIALKVSIMKFCFFTDVLAFHLDELNRLVKWNRKKGSAKQLRHCWQLKRLLEKIFGWPLLFNCGVLIIGTVHTIHLFYENLKNNVLIFTFIFAYTDLFIVGFVSHIIERKITAIEGSIFSKSRIDNEMLILQLQHQNLKVTPFRICQINHEFVVSVCTRNFL